MPRLLSLLAGVLVTCLLLPARSAASDPGPLYAWTMPPPEQQLAADETVIPIGKGAVFVPTITGAEHEPPALLVAEDTTISVPVGERFLVDPGTYTVIVSPGAPADGVGIAIEVREGETTLVPVRWGALQIEVTDVHRIPHRGAYELIRADTREPVGTGFGADTLQGETLPTWLLAPGLYRVVRPGQNFRATTDFATVVIPEGGFVRYRLVMDEDTGDFLGAGVLLPDEFASSAERRFKRWFRSLDIGFDGSMVRNQNVVGAFNQTQYDGSAYLDGQFGLIHDRHHFTVLLQAEEGVSQIRPQDGSPLPLVKGTDRLRADVLHTIDLQGTTGPYFRASAETQAFPTEVLVTEDTTIITRSADGSVMETTDVPANETFRLADAWRPTLAREGIGINHTFRQKRTTTAFNLRLGFGMRQNVYDGALVLDDRSHTSALEYTAVETFYQQGIEATVIAGLRLPGRLIYATDVELFADFGSFSEPWSRTDTLGIPYPPWSVNWRNTLSLRLTRNLSLNYYLNIDIEPQVIDKPQVEQSLLLRATWSVL